MFNLVTECFYVAASDISLLVKHFCYLSAVTVCFRSSASLTPVSVRIPDKVTRRFSTSSVTHHSPSVCTLKILWVFVEGGPKNRAVFES